MHTIHLKAEITESGHLHLDVPSGLPRGPVEVLLVLRQEHAIERHSIRELRGPGKEIWENTDAQTFISALRDEWER